MAPTPAVRAGGPTPTTIRAARPTTRGRRGATTTSSSTQRGLNLGADRAIHRATGPNKRPAPPPRRLLLLVAILLAQESRIQYVHSATTATLEVEVEVEVEAAAAAVASDAATAIAATAAAAATTVAPGTYRNAGPAAVSRPPLSAPPPLSNSERGSHEVAVRPSTISGAGLGAFGT